MVPLAVGLWLTHAPAPAVWLGWALLAMIGVQGAIGYTQYFTGLPAGLVWVHVCGSTLIWILALLLVFALRDRGSLTTGTGQPEASRRPRARPVLARGDDPPEPPAGPRPGSFATEPGPR